MNKIFSIILIIAIAGSAVYYGINYYQKNKTPLANTEETATSTEKIDWQQYANSEYGFELSYPQNFQLAEGTTSSLWSYFNYYEGEKIASVSVPKSDYQNTNFGEANINIGASQDPGIVINCLRLQIELGETKDATQTINGIIFKRFDSSDAGAGNFYETQSYRTIKDKICYALEIIIHSMNIGNYPQELNIKEFDRNKVIGDLTSVLNTFKFTDIK